MIKPNKSLFVYFMGLFLLAFSSIASAQSYYNVPLSDLVLESDHDIGSVWAFSGRRGLLPYVIGDNNEEAYPVTDRDNDFISALIIKTSSEESPSGALIYNNYNYPEYIRFEVETKPGDSDTLAKVFDQAKAEYFSKLSSAGYPGAAYFRHLAQAESTQENSFVPENDLQQMMGMFNGSRAISENIQLDRELRLIGEDTERKIDINDIEGITVREYDWKSLNSGIKTRNDKLAELVPFDQYALFFPKFDSMVKAIDYANENFAQMKTMVEGRSINALTLDRYQKQLCLPLDEFSKMIGRQMVQSVVFTGSDPYLRTGSDVAVIFETSQPKILQEMISQYYTGAANIHMHASLVSGDISGVKYNGVETTDRSVCSYIASIPGAVVVTNSKFQLQQIASTVSGKLAKMSSLDEYKFFRARYDATDDGQSAFLIVTDAAIRKWCSPVWRIAAVRRTIAMAKVAELQARLFDAVYSGSSTVYKPEVVDSLGKTVIVNNIVVSENYGSLNFQVPIAEMNVDMVSVQEQRAYTRFRDSYQRRWANFFDPIAASISISGTSSDLDLTVMPLILDSEYRVIADVTSPASLPADAGIMNNDTMFELTLSLNKQSMYFQMARNYMTGMLASTGDQEMTVGYDPLSWLGDWVTFNIQKGAIWSQMVAQAEAEDTSIYHILEKRLSSGDSNLPVSLLFDVENKIGANMFIVTLNGILQSMSPFAVVSEPRFYDNKKYINLAIRTGDSNDESLSVYYAVAGDVLIFTFSEDIVKMHLDNKLRTTNRHDSFYNGSNMAVKVDDGMLGFLQSVEDLQNNMYYECWRNLPVLNYYRQQLGIKDPVAAHQKYWGELLECPAGGEYVWDEKFHTYSSTVLGHPGDIKEPETFMTFDGIKAFYSSIKFENDGIRVKAGIEHKRK